MSWPLRKADRAVQASKQISARVARLDDMVVKGTESLKNFNVKQKATRKQADVVAYLKTGLQACLQPSQCGRDKVSESSTCIQRTIDRFSSDLKEDQEYRERRAVEESHKMLKQFGT